MMRRLTTMMTLGVLLLATQAHAEWRMALGVTTASVTSSRLYRASAEERTTWRWEQPGGDASLVGNEVLVETSGLFDGDFLTTLQYGIRFSWLSEESHWGAVVTAGFADLDVVATVRTARDNVDEVIWDQFFTTQVLAMGTYALARGEQTPYLLGGLGWVVRSSTGDELDQSSPAVVLGAGLRLWNGGRSLIDLELRGVWTPLDTDDEDARLSAEIERQNERDRPGLESEYAFDGEDTTVAVEISASWSYVF